MMRKRLDVTFMNYALARVFKCLIAIRIGAHHAIVRFVSNVTLIVLYINYLYIRPTFESYPQSSCIL